MPPVSTIPGQTVPIKPQLNFTAAASAAADGAPGGELGVSRTTGSTTTLPPQAPGATTTRTDTQTISLQAGYQTDGPSVGAGVNRASQILKTFQGVPYDRKVRSFGVGAGFATRGPAASVSFTNSRRGLDPSESYSTSAAAGFGPAGPNLNFTRHSPRLSIQLGVNNFNVGPVPVGSLIPGSWGAVVTFRSKDESHQWFLDKATQSLVFYGEGEGKAAFSVGAVGVGSVGIPFAIPGRDAVPQRRLQLPPAVIQALDAFEQSGISSSHLGGRTLETVRQTLHGFRTDLFRKFEAETGVSALQADGTPKARKQLEAELWEAYRGQHSDTVAPLEKEPPPQDAQKQLAALRETALRPISQLETALTTTVMPANASVHVFPPGAMAQQTELLKNFEQVTGVSPFKDNGSLKSPKELNRAVSEWFEKSNKPLFDFLRERQGPSDPAVARDATQRIQALQKFALAQVAPPTIPSPDQLRASIREQQQRELQGVRGGPQKPWEQRSEQNLIGYRTPYAHQFNLDANHSVSVNSVDGQATATSRLTLAVTTPDHSAPRSTVEQRTGGRQIPQKTFRVEYEQQLALNPEVPASVSRHRIKEGLKADETRLLQQFHRPLSAAARQGGSVDETVQSLIASLPIGDISPRGEVTSQQLSLRTPKGALAIRASHTVEIIRPEKGDPFGIAQIVLETNLPGAPRSTTTFEQRVDLDASAPEAAAAAVRADLYRRIVGAGQTEGILRNGLGALLSGQPLPEALAPGFRFVPLGPGQTAEDRLISLRQPRL